MRPINIDFSETPRFRRSSLVWLVLAVLALALAAGHYWEVSDELKGVESRISLERRALERMSREIEDTATLPAEQVMAINEAILLLNTPWEKLFDVLEKRLTEDVALLSVNPDNTHRQLSIVAETRTPAAMTHFVGSLLEDEFLNDAMLQRHRIEEGTAGRPYRFTVEARWDQQ